MGGKEIAKALLLVVVFGVISWQYMVDLEDHPIHMDEHEWVKRGVLFYDLFFIERNYQDRLWRGYYSYDQAKLSEYMYGIWLNIFYSGEAKEVMDASNFNEGLNYHDHWYKPNKWWIKYQWLDSPLEIMPEEYYDAYRIIVNARYLSVIFGLISLLILFIIGNRLGGYWLGFLSLILLGTNSDYYTYVRFAMSQSILVFFILLAWLGYIWWVDSWKKGDGLVYAGIYGLILGLSAASKLNGWMLLIVVSLLYGGELFSEWWNKKLSRGNWWRFLLILVIIWIVAIVVFFSLHPYLWKDPLRNFYFMVEKRWVFAHNLSTRDNGLVSWVDRIRYLFATLSGANNYLKHGGLVVFIGVVVSSYYRNNVFRKATVWLILVWVIVSVYCAIEWSRYVLPVLPFWSVVMAYGGLVSIGWLTTKWKQLRLNEKLIKRISE